MFTGWKRIKSAFSKCYVAAKKWGQHATVRRPNSIFSMFLAKESHSKNPTATGLIAVLIIHKLTPRSTLPWDLDGPWYPGPARFSTKNQPLWPADFRPQSAWPAECEVKKTSCNAKSLKQGDGNNINQKPLSGLQQWQHSVEHDRAHFFQNSKSSGNSNKTSMWQGCRKKYYPKLWPGLHHFPNTVLQHWPHHLHGDSISMLSWHVSVLLWLAARSLSQESSTCLRSN